MWTTGSVARSLPTFQGRPPPIQEQRSPASYDSRPSLIASPGVSAKPGEAVTLLGSENR